MNNIVEKLLLVTLLFLLSGCAATYRSDQLSNLTELQAISEIEQLNTRYLEMMDDLQNQLGNGTTAESMAEDLFLDKATVKVGEWKTFTASEYTQWLADAYKPGFYVKHISMNTLVEVSGNTATSTEHYLMLYSDSKSKNSGWLIGQFINTLEKNTHGQWQYRSKSSTAEDFKRWPSENP